MSVVSEAYVAGVFTRKVEKRIEAKPGNQDSISRASLGTCALSLPRVIN